MAGFDSIPDEVLLSIISHLDRSIRDLAALSVQCRRFHSVIDLPTRKRFHRFRFRNQTIRQARYASQKIIEIIKQPSLRQYVRQLELRPPAFFAMKIRPYDEPEDEVTELFMATMKTAGFSDDEYLRVLLSKFVANLRDPGQFRGDESSGIRLLAGSDEASTVLLIKLCPNIDTLKIGPAGWPLADLLKRINSKNSTSGSLQRLREVRLINEAYDERDYGSFDLIRTMRYFHRLPSIESIHLDGAYFGEDMGDLFRLVPKTSNFSKILIDHSSMSSYELAAIIRHPKALDEFRFNLGGRSVDDNSSCSVLPKTLGRALQTQKSSLQVLDLDLDSDIEYGAWSEGPGELESEDDRDYDSDHQEQDSDPDDVSIANPSDVDKFQKFGKTIGSFHDFTALTHLSIGVKLLLGPEDPFEFDCLVQRLPPNLEYLCIRGFDKKLETYSSTISQFMEMREECLPSLKEVRGIDELIPSASHVERPDDESDLLWEDTDSWAEDESSSSDDSEGNNSDASDGDAEDSCTSHNDVNETKECEE